MTMTTEETLEMYAAHAMQALIISSQGRMTYETLAYQSFAIAEVMAKESTREGTRIRSQVEPSPAPPPFPDVTSD